MAALKAHHTEENMDKKLLTIDVSHGTTHDGPGMRTTVFVKGCPLHCRWCQNPESIHVRNEVWWDASSCIGCLSCAAACTNDAIRPLPGRIHIEREKCRSCGACVEACPAAAMLWEGQEYDLESLLREVLRDRTFYDQFGGGVTCSGGEPLLHAEFVEAFFSRLQEEKISTALDTCGCVPWENLECVLPYTNYLLYDMKIFDSALHRKFTGQPNEKILNNLICAASYMRSADHPIKLWIRTPLIYGATATVDNIRRIGSFLRENAKDVLERWEMPAFNGVCVSKYEKLEQKWDYDGMGAMTRQQIAPLRKAAEEFISKEKVLVSGMIREE